MAPSDTGPTERRRRWSNRRPARWHSLRIWWCRPCRSCTWLGLGLGLGLGVGLGLAAVAAAPPPRSASRRAGCTVALARPSRARHAAAAPRAAPG
eukprot:scaffold124928_cov60-Phaeocystis_antarctica.AAC.1